MCQALVLHWILFLSFSDRKQIQSQLGQGCSMDSLRERKAISVTTWTRVLHGLLLAGNERRRLSCEHEILILGFVCLFVCCVWGHEQHTRSTILLHWRMRFGGWKKSVKTVLSTNVWAKQTFSLLRTSYAFIQCNQRSYERYLLGPLFLATLIQQHRFLQNQCSPLFLLCKDL